jgi:monofunctional biosynthetic peptidoglycan transglycosylase
MKSRKGDGKSIEKEWVSIDNISKSMQLAVICGEDQRFCYHSGFDFEAIKKAAESNKAGGKLRGASTISQQTAKNVFLWEGRSWVRKGLEAWFTVLIEFIWGKKRIMEVYLNVIETGEGTFGVEAAARKYYRTSAAKLSGQQAAYISGLLPCPRKCGLYSGFTSQRAQIIYYAMTRYGLKLEYLE